MKEYNVGKLEFARQKVAYAYFSIAAVLPHPELSDARISWAQNTVLTTVVDDFFDFAGSMEELLNLIELLQRYNIINILINHFMFYPKKFKKKKEKFNWDADGMSTQLLGSSQKMWRSSFMQFMAQPMI